jgi:Domain of unknown function (DUF4157)
MTMYRQQVSKRTSLPRTSMSVNQGIVPSQNYGSLSAVVQRAQQDANSLSEEERQQLESAIGTRSTKEILAGKQGSWVPEFQGISGQLWGNAGQAGVPIQAKVKDDVGVSEVQSENKTGLPDDLKAGVENLSGYSLNNVKVHYNSSKPAQLQALAYTQGTDIHVAPGQEKHLPHEAWHVVQQMQGRVKPILQMKGVEVNDDEGLEREADVMGRQVNNEEECQQESLVGEKSTFHNLSYGLQSTGSEQNCPIQRKIGFEYEMEKLGCADATPVSFIEKIKFSNQVDKASKGKIIKSDFTTKTDMQRRNYLGSGELIDNATGKDMVGTTKEKMGNYRFHALSKKEKIIGGNGFTLEADEGNANADGSGTSNIEFVTDAFEENKDGENALKQALSDFVDITKKIKSFAGKRKTVHALEVSPEGGVRGKVIYPSDKLEGVPQVTGAIKLGQIPKLMESMSKGEGEDRDFTKRMIDIRDLLGRGINGAETTSSTGTAPNQAKKAIEELSKSAVKSTPSLFGSRELNGLLSLMASYMMAANNPKLGYVKTIAPIMARTNFAAMFGLLKPEEQKYLKDDCDKKDLMQMFSTATGGLNMTDDLFPYGIYTDPRTQGSGEKNALQGLTRQQWVIGVINGIDYLTAAKFNQNPDLHLINPGNKKEDLESMGAMGNKMENVGDKDLTEQAPIFEIRSLGQHSTVEQFTERAIEIFNFIVRLNKDK